MGLRLVGRTRAKRYNHHHGAKKSKTYNSLLIRQYTVTKTSCNRSRINAATQGEMALIRQEQQKIETNIVNDSAGIEVLINTPQAILSNNGLLITSYQNVSLSATQSVTAKKTLWRWKKLRFFLPRISMKARISHCPHLAFSLRLTHRDRQRTNSDLRTPDGDEQGLDSPTTTYPTPPSSLNDPVEAFKRQGKGEHVLENEEARESFDGHAA